jgi:hypothetical protein
VVLGVLCTHDAVKSVPWTMRGSASSPHRPRTLYPASRIAARQRCTNPCVTESNRHTYQIVLHDDYVQGGRVQACWLPSLKQSHVLIDSFQQEQSLHAVQGNGGRYIKQTPENVPTSIDLGGSAAGGASSVPIWRSERCAKPIWHRKLPASGQTTAVACGRLLKPA